MLTSVIIPVYNTGPYLRRCAQSVLDQTYRDLEIILVDDGSEYKTALICDELIESDPRVRVIHKPNGGVSSARNVGLDHARGEVICFVDSDDTISPRMIETLMEALEANDAGIAMCDAVTIRPGHPDGPDTIPDYPVSCLIETKDIAPATLTRLAGSAWRCAYRRTDTPRFPEGLKFSEDRIFNIIAMAGAERIAYIKKPLYNRLIRNGSACFSHYSDMTAQLEKIRAVLIPAVRERWGEKYVPAYEGQLAGQIRYAVTNYTAIGVGVSLRSRLASLKSLCESQSVRQCLTSTSARDLRARAILAGRYRFLYLIGRLTNIYHKICHRSQYQA